jgi:TolB-like protein
MDLLSCIAGWLGENEATISAVVGIAVLAGIVLAGLRPLVRRRDEAAQATTLSATATEPALAADSSPADLDPLTVPGFEGHPAIAVLPFDNLSGDPNQEYFADGLAEDLITRLAAWRWFPVIARNSSFTYKGTSVDVKQVSRELGARYVLEGSVRRQGDQVRINAQLIDATTGAHVWAETYDREMRDIFALQDEITGEIIVSMHPEQWRSELERVGRREPSNLDAWDCVMRGLWYQNRSTKEDNNTARLLFERAIEIDPLFAWAHSLLSRTHYDDIRLQWSESPSQSHDEMVRGAERSVELDFEASFAHMTLGVARYMQGKTEKGIGELELAVELDPNSAEAYRVLGGFLGISGRPDDAIESLQKALRLNPKGLGTGRILYNMAIAQLAAGRYRECTQYAERCLERQPANVLAHGLLASAHGHLDQFDDAREALARITESVPGFTLAFLDSYPPIKSADPVFVDRLCDGLRKAGVKE